ncbi:hypothetical protein [Undibacterium sp. TJN19]|uniref:hypothetical protein n=1 Tax=Undibacterium sp. TJN19 TaxID=3413055 RepID=UPI003BF2E5A6
MSHALLRKITFAFASMLCAATVNAGDTKDPSSGKLVLFPGQLPSNNYGGGDYIQTFSGWNVPGKHFKTGDGWWVFACKKSCELSSAAMTVKDSTHADYDGPPLLSQLMKWSPLPFQLDDEKRYGSSENALSPERARKPFDPILLAMFKPTGELANRLHFSVGPVTTWWHHGMTNLPKSNGDFSRTSIEIGNGKQAILSQRFINLPKQPNDKEEQRQLLIELQIDGIRQTLASYTFHMELEEFRSPKSYLMWIGDIDGDGKVDIFINSTSYYWNTTMFLSSLAKKGELVGKAGNFNFSPPDSAGC